MKQPKIWWQLSCSTSFPSLPLLLIPRPRLFDVVAWIIESRDGVEHKSADLSFFFADEACLVARSFLTPAALLLSYSLPSFDCPTPVLLLDL